MSDTPVNPLAQSDEDFLNSMPPATVVVEDNSSADAGAGDQGDGGNPPVAKEPEGETNPPAKADEGVVPLVPAEGTNPEVSKDPEDDKPIIGGLPEMFKKPGEAPANPNPEAKPEAGKEPGDKSAGEVKDTKDPPEGTAVEYQVPNKIRANGKDIEIRSQQEAVQLMQMGANYTRRMQEIAPQRHLLMMLQNNGIADKDSLSFLIDIHNKNPEAIAKLVKDAGIDPIDINTESSSSYQPGDHSVTDDEANFRTAVIDLAGQEGGTETVAEINTKWDSVSKEVIWKKPEILSVIHEQKQMGIYDLITTEMDRQITLGKIPAGTPFLEAYKTVGDELSKAALAASGGASGDQPAAQPGQSATPGGNSPAVTPPATQPVARRVATPKPAVQPGDKAGSASLTRTTPNTARTVINPLSMSDEDFMKTMEGRL